MQGLDHGVPVGFAPDDLGLVQSQGQLGAADAREQGQLQLQVEHGGQLFVEHAFDFVVAHLVEDGVVVQVEGPFIVYLVEPHLKWVQGPSLGHMVLEEHVRHVDDRECF